MSTTTLAARARGLLLPGLCLVLVGILTAAVLGVARSAGPASAPGGVDGAGRPVDLRAVPADPPAPAPGPDASTGRVRVDCGRNAEGHYNQDNLVVSPGLPGGAHHTHSYVGNLSASARSTDGSLAAATTTCRGGDRSVYYWPVLRRPDRPADRPYERSAGHGNTGAVLPEASVAVEFLGNPVSKVVPMPRFLRAVTGNAVAATARDDSLVRARWGCAGLPDRGTASYPRCPSGDRITRTLLFPSCWNGLDTDSPAHREHLRFPAPNGVCPAGTFPVPALRLSLSYDVPSGAPLALDSFPEQRHSPKTDHAMFVDVMTDAAMDRVVDCLNSGRTC
ncbi:DUF1996 domain-containing protein [Streptomyces sp. NRRL S-87]|uniref:DUF1996 domain-containing protein n=1 Tax=Streptomyces sp. NRRL S-87 TaxID=1463920 RepID=UPI00068933FE|nr:DUF1996 domain-containing protein [Streptomyces sp. NRRL S-87]